MHLSLIIALLVVAMVMVLTLLYKKLSPRHDLDLPIAQCFELTVEAYRPMERLLREDDFRFLVSQRGFSPQMGRRFRAERRKIFRAYLFNLRKDFGQIILVCKLMVVHADEDRVDLAKTLIWCRLMFSLAIVAVETRLLLHTAGIGTVEVSGLFEFVGSMQALLRVQLVQCREANMTMA